MNGLECHHCIKYPVVDTSSATDDETDKNNAASVSPENSVIRHKPID